MKINIMQVTERGLQISCANEDWVTAAFDAAIDGTVKECNAHIELDRYKKRI